MLPVLLVIDQREVNYRQEQNEARRRLQIRIKLLRDESNPFDMPAQKFVSEFRLNKDHVRYLIDEIQNFLPPSRRDAIPLELQVLASLSFYAIGSYQRIIGGSFMFPMCQSSMIKIIHRITNIIYSNLADRWIRFPSSDEEKMRLSIPFQNVMTVTNIFGAVDGTLINILAPKDEEHNYVDRKGNDSKNVQILCDFNLHILSIDARYTGSAHDAYIWNNSMVHYELRTCHEQGSPYKILGDSGYPQQPWLLTPIRNAEPDTPECYYTLSHCRARNCIERCIGVLKNSFRCISSDNRMRYTPAFVGRIISVVAALHNICIDNIIDNLNYENLINEDNNYYDNENDMGVFDEGVDVRQNIIDNYFT